MRKFAEIIAEVWRAMSMPYVMQVACLMLLALVAFGSIGCHGQVHAKENGYGPAVVDLAWTGIDKSLTQADQPSEPVTPGRNEYDEAYYKALRMGATLCVVADQPASQSDYYRTQGYIVATVHNDLRFAPGIHFFAKKGNQLVESGPNGIAGAIDHAEPVNAQAFEIEEQIEAANLEESRPKANRKARRSRGRSCGPNGCG